MTMETLNVAEARKQFSELVARVAYTGERVIIERRGKPMMALVSMADLKRLEELADDQEAIRRQRMAALERAAALRQEMKQAGIFLSDSAELINQLREERDHELSGLR
jgi:prevent-host-death family protein